MSSNRVLGSLYKRHGPARQPGALHHTSEAEWPWAVYPPFLDPGLVLFTQDTLAPLLRAAASVPLFRHHEIWLMGLVSLQAGVIRMGLKDSLAPLPRPLPGPGQDCWWAGRAGVGGLTPEDQEAVTWARRVRGAEGCGATPEVREVRDTCGVR